MNEETDKFPRAWIPGAGLMNEAGEHIKTRTTYHRIANAEEWIKLPIFDRHFKIEYTERPIGMSDTDIKAVARVDDGIWLADCPWEHCGGAEMVSFEDPRFFCLGCFNRQWGGQWIAVELPDEALRLAVEKALLERPHHKFRFWHPGQTVVDLQTENALHEVW